VAFPDAGKHVQFLFWVGESVKDGSSFWRILVGISLKSGLDIPRA